MLKNADPELIKTICEICYNTLNGNLNLNRKDKTKLGKYKKAIRTIADPYRSLASKRRVIIQHGNGIIPVLLQTLIPLIISAITK